MDDNVKMKMVVLGILNKFDFLVDIFGDNILRGFVDVEFNEDFDVRLLYFKEVGGITL